VFVVGEHGHFHQIRLCIVDIYYFFLFFLQHTFPSVTATSRGVSSAVAGAVGQEVARAKLLKPSVAENEMPELPPSKKAKSSATAAVAGTAGSGGQFVFNVSNVYHHHHHGHRVIDDDDDDDDDDDGLEDDSS
jgi:hypothetical protein